MFRAARTMPKSFVFVTGNANKLKEVKAILAVGDSGIEVTNQAVDGMSCPSSPSSSFLTTLLRPPSSLTFPPPG